MSIPAMYIVSPTDSGVTYQVGDRLFNFRTEEHGDHLHADLSIHVVAPGVSLGGGRSLPIMRIRNFGACRFRVPLSEQEADPTWLMAFIESVPFQEFVVAPLDDLAGCVDPSRFGMLPD